MSTPEDSPGPPENHEECFGPEILSKLSDYQLRWLNTQGRALSKSSGQVLNDVLSEWFVRHPLTGKGGVVSIETIQTALETFISSHHAEFLSIDFSK